MGGGGGGGIDPFDIFSWFFGPFLEVLFGSNPNTP
jgi:hypothetical protein